MSRKNSSGKEVSIDEQCYTDPGADTRERLVPSSDQMTRVKVDANAPDSALQYRGLTLEQEEKARAEEREIARTRWARSADDRERRTKRVVEASTDEPEWFEPSDLEEVDWAIREELEREAKRLHEATDGVWTVEAIAKQMLAHVEGETGSIAGLQRDGKGWSEALFATLADIEQSAAGTVPIEHVDKLDRESVDVEGEIVKLWTPSHTSIQQVGLIADDTDTTKFTIWRKSRQPTVREGDRVRFRDTKRNFYRGRWSIALAGDSRIQFIETVPRPDPADRVQGDGASPQRDSRSPMRRLREAPTHDDGPSRPLADAEGTVETDLGVHLDTHLTRVQ